MKKFSIIFFASLLSLGLTTGLLAQVTTISLEQTPGVFTTTSLDLPAGEYQFNIANNGVDKELGFVLTPKGKSDQASHIQEAYVKKTVANGESSLTGVVKLAPGEYEYFCPLNPTERYPLTVREDIQKVSLEQVPGKFTQESLMLKSGKYVFEISNEGVDKDLGFVIAPKGMTDQANHIPEAYVKSLVSNGSSSLTGVVNLQPGEYVYFCPLNPTELHELTVK